MIASALKQNGPGGKIAGAILGGIGNLMKMGTHALNKKNETEEKTATKSANDKNVEKYINKEADALIVESEAQADQMTKEEAKIIVALRLEVKDPTNYEEVYKKLSERRADRILNKEDGYEEVLAAMGLTEPTDKATILEALGAS